MPPATLFVVATPIGNLEDISLRALRILRTSDLIAAEDTRRTAKLLSHYSISKKSTSFHLHNARTRIPQLLSQLLEGKSVALVTDAGTPGISDPGTDLIQACLAEGVPVDPIPGATAPIAAAVASGFPLNPFTILGFAPSRSKDRLSWCAWSSTIAHTFSFFDSPHRIAKTLDVASSFWGNRAIVVAREVTKLHQEFIRGTARTVSSAVEPAIGEFTVIVGPGMTHESKPELVSDSDILTEFGRITECAGLSRRGSVARVAESFGLTTKYVYSAIERAKQDVSI